MIRRDRGPAPLAPADVAAEIARIVARWLGPGRTQLATMSAKAKAMGHHQATFEIVRSIVGLVES